MQEKTQIDENLYSRQLFVLGHDAMKKMLTSNILFIGLSGPATETVKNCILAGVNSVTLYDPSTILMQDMSYNFYFSEDDIGKQKDKVLQSKIAHLNNYVRVEVLQNTQPIKSEEFSYLSNISVENIKKEIDFSKFTTVVVSNTLNSTAEEINNLAREKNCKFVFCHTRGFFSQCFVDVGKEFVCTDLTGDAIKTGVGNLYCRDNKFYISTLNNNQIEPGTFLEILEEQQEETKREIWKEIVKVVKKDSPKILEVEFKEATENFIQSLIIELKISIDITVEFEEKRFPTVFNTETLKNSLNEPKILCEPDNLEQSKIIHNCFRTLCISNFRNKKSLHEFLEIYAENFTNNKELNSEEINNKELQTVEGFYNMSNGIFVPILSTVGGFISQEVLKTVSGKFKPLTNFLYYECFSAFFPLLEINNKINNNSNKYNNKYNNKYSKTKYEPLEILFKQHTEEIFKTSPFVIGSGAIGCEHLKNMAMLGFGTLNSKIYLTDMDSIEVSNLNRQFLFNSSNVGKMKSTTAATAVTKMNPDIKIDSFTYKVDHEFFGSEFVDKISLFANALDNIEARLYVDGLAIDNEKALFDSGTLGTKGNTQTVLPHLSESYGSMNDPPEAGIPLCTLKNFPTSHIHTTEFALSEFNRIFVEEVQDVVDIINNTITSDNNNINNNNINNNNNAINNNNDEKILNCPVNLEELVVLSLRLFNVVFDLNVLKLLEAFPENHTNKDGTKFWDMRRKRPKIIKFDRNKNEHLLFIFCLCYILNNILNLKEKDVEMKEIEEILSELSIEDVYNKSILFNSKGISNLESIDSEVVNTNNTNINNTNSSFYDKLTKNNYTKTERIEKLLKLKEKILPTKFEKDDAENLHVKFIHSLSMLRCENYNIKKCSELETKGIAGKIIPAIATTTAMVSGLSVTEMVKFVLFDNLVKKTERRENFEEEVKNKIPKIYASHEKTNSEISKKLFKDPLDIFCNSYINLAHPYFVFSSPFNSFKTDCPLKTGEITFWDKIKIENMKILEIVDFFKKFNLTVSMINLKNKMVYCNFYGDTKRFEQKTIKEINKEEFKIEEEKIILDLMVDEVEEFPKVEVV